VIPVKIGYSPCPNDTYIMAALAGDRVDTPLLVDTVLADVETLNQWALEERLEVTKLSFMALGHVRDSYGLLYSGGALGNGCGPIVVARPGKRLDDLKRGVIAAPGDLTTARLLLGLYLGDSPDFRQMLFSDIMPAVAEGKADFGLVIHEGRFTYAEHGLELLLDLGQWWEQETGCPIPLGGIAVRRDLGFEVAMMVDDAIRRSLLNANMSEPETLAYVMKHAQEMDPAVVMQHIQLYVNTFSINLGPEGQEAVEKLFARAEKAGLMKASVLPLMAYGV
jgi:1,4-dihydroxy-6-naphthoate synthase